MVLPVIPHRLTKINTDNRERLIKTAFVFSIVGCFCDIISVSTNNWLYTSEVLRYYVFPNQTDSYEDHTPPTYFKNATLGPWRFCWLDPITEFHCTQVDIFTVDDPSDVTSSVEQSVRRSFVFMVSGCALDVIGFLSILLCCVRKNAYRTLFMTTIIHILAGLTNFCCIIVYMSAVSKEVGNKIYRVAMDDSLFHYSYGFSLILLKLAALFSVIVYMSKRDERTYNRYCMSTILKNLRDGDSIDPMLLADKYYQHSRIHCLQRASRWSDLSIDESLNSLRGTQRKSQFLLPNELLDGPESTQDDRSEVSSTTLTAYSNFTPNSALQRTRSVRQPQLTHPFLLGATFGYGDTGYI
ncbi:PMP-22/EMP/MP20/Claudin family domain-containing protein [Ditylenchus destructor]|uniref:PMP-22/EMP/MP20/Claudin family domain-containing protein n=1 Tax=Ditylenchus destructor TaxID=166010 RepID=A0AAD4N1Y6_9BILA|nr:PMP-22/EMP/MP20/Claudin family domain-containing protein [Ditylenchus destructor]